MFAIVARGQIFEKADGKNAQHKNKQISFVHERGTRNPLALITFSQTLSCLWIFLDSDLFLASWPGNCTHLLCPRYHLPEATFDITFKGRV
jgi:hypothetical protein